MNHIGAIERYRDYKKTIHELMASIFLPGYSMISIGLFFVVGILLYFTTSEIATLFLNPQTSDLHIKPFGIIIFLTLALGIYVSLGAKAEAILKRSTSIYVCMLMIGIIIVKYKLRV